MFEKEENGKSEDGFYQHKETGAVVELVNDPDLGTPLTNSYIRAGFVYAGKTDPRIAQEAAKAETARLEAERIEMEAAEKKRLEEENAQLKKELENSKKSDKEISKK